jgi:beta-glucanase (GH16 family)
MHKRGSVSAATLQPAGIAGHWKLALDSKFNGSGLPRYWHAGWFGSGVTAPVNHSEQACYSPKNVTFPGDRAMHLAVTHQASSCSGMVKPYTGAMVTTDPNDGRSSLGYEFSRGVVEARVYIPADGTRIADWPAVWTDGQNWPADGEDDLMEGLGGSACYHFHDPLGGPGGCDRTLTPGWHTFSSNWEPGSVTYYYDGVRVGAIRAGITSARMFILLDNTVSPGQPHTTVADSMRVQYVRVWQS